MNASNSANAKKLFPTTQWTHVFGLQLGDQARREAALAELVASYWKPVYYYVRHKGHDEESAKDLTQGFFQKMLSSHGVVQKADPARGRFRTFLLTCLNRYLSDVFRTERTKRHMPAGGLVSLETVNWAKAPVPVQCTPPLEAYDYAWGCALLDKVLAEVEAKCREKGTVAQWELFGAKVLEPIRDNVDPPSLTCLCEKYGIANKTVASNMIYTVKRRFRALLRCHVRHLVDSDAAVDEEIRELIAIFSKGKAISPAD